MLAPPPQQFHDYTRLARQRFLIVELLNTNTGGGAIPLHVLEQTSLYLWGKDVAWCLNCDTFLVVSLVMIGVIYYTPIKIKHGSKSNVSF